MDKPIKVTLDCLGVPVKCVFVREKRCYKSKISRTTATRIHKVAAEMVAKCKHPGHEINVSTGVRFYDFLQKYYVREIHVSRFIDSANGKTDIEYFTMDIEMWSFAAKECTLEVSLNMFDWMLAEKMKVAQNTTYLEHEKPALEKGQRKFLECTQ